MAGLLIVRLVWPVSPGFFALCANRYGSSYTTGMLEYPIIDTHVHFWDPQRLRYHWLNGIEKLNKPYLPANYNAACGAVHVEKLVFVQCDCLPEQSIREVEFVNELAGNDSRIAGIVAFAAVERGKDVRNDLQKLSREPRVKGIRRLLQGESDVEFCLRPEFLEGVTQLAEFGLSFDICIRHPQLKASTEMVRRLPQVQFVLDHVAKPDIKSQLFDPWKSELKELSELPNVSCKISGMVAEADLENWKPADLRAYIDHVVDCFGPERIMFGSDWPVVLLASSYERWVETLLDTVSSMNHEDRRRLFHDNAARFYRLH